ncbi:MAG: carbohydrate ABC transporter permease [Anaerolineales bacterium]
MKLFFKKGGGPSTLTVRLWEFTGSALLGLLVFVIAAVYLSPLVYMLFTSVKGSAQLNDLQAPLYPAVNPQFNYQGKDYPVMVMPTADGEKEWAMITPRRGYADFIDPQNPGRGPIRWNGNWRALRKAYHFSITLEAFIPLLKSARIFTGLVNTLLLVLITEIGVLLSSIAVAYGFSRFRIPGGKWLFLLLVAAILIPGSATRLPTYFIFMKLGWLGSWYPLILPYFFGSATCIFLLRQNFKSIPRDLDEAAMLDGAGPLQILIKIILPQSIPVIATIALLHFFYIWNETTLASLYIGTQPDLQPFSFVVQNDMVSYGSALTSYAGVEAHALVLLVVPAVVLLLCQRFFMQDMIVTGLEK